MVASPCRLAQHPFRRRSFRLRCLRTHHNSTQEIPERHGLLVERPLRVTATCQIHLTHEYKLTLAYDGLLGECSTAAVLVLLHADDIGKSFARQTLLQWVTQIQC